MPYIGLTQTDSSVQYIYVEHSSDNNKRLDEFVKDHYPLDNGQKATNIVKSVNCTEGNASTGMHKNSITGHFILTKTWKQMLLSATKSLHTKGKLARRCSFIW